MTWVRIVKQVCIRHSGDVVLVYERGDLTYLPANVAERTIAAGYAEPWSRAA